MVTYRKIYKLWIVSFSMTQKDNSRARPQKYEEATDPLNPNYKGPVMIEVSRDKPFNWRTVVPENPKANLEDIL